jgi:hypothetical protein
MSQSLDSSKQSKGSKQVAMKKGFFLASLFLYDTASAFVVSRAHQLPRHTLSASWVEEAQQQPQMDIPFFASVATIDKSSKRETKIKSRNEETRLITVDGEKMAKISESEPREVLSLIKPKEVRSLMAVFPSF